MNHRSRITAIFLLAYPIVIAQLGGILQGWADTIMVGQYGTPELSAAGFVNNVFNLCIYFLLDFSNTDLLEKGEKFTLYEGAHTHDFEWLAFERLKDEYFYPLFLKTAIFDLPEHLTLRTETE